METGKIYKQMIAIMKDVEAVGKNNINKIQQYKFRGIDDVYNTLHNLFAKHEIFIMSEIISEKREERTSKNGGLLLWTLLDIKFTFYADDGSSVSTVTKGEAMDSGDKSSNKAMAAASKYALVQTFLIPTENKIDTENNSPEIMQTQLNNLPGNLKNYIPNTKEIIKKRIIENAKGEITNMSVENNAIEASRFFDDLPAHVKEYTKDMTKQEKWIFCKQYDWSMPEIDVAVVKLQEEK